MVVTSNDLSPLRRVRKGVSYAVIFWTDMEVFYNVQKF